MLNVCVLLELENLTQQPITLSTMLHKQAVTHGAQWDKYLPGMLWAYRNTLTTLRDQRSHLFFIQHWLSHPNLGSTTFTSQFRSYQWLQQLQTRNGPHSDWMQLWILEMLSSDTRANIIRMYMTLSLIKISDWVLVYFLKEDSGKNCVSCLVHGMDHTVSMRRKILMLLYVKCTFLNKAPSKYTNNGFKFVFFHQGIILYGMVQSL